MQRYNILLRQPNVWPFLEVATPKSWCTTPKPTPTHGIAARPRAHIRTPAAAHETSWVQPPNAPTRQTRHATIGLATVHRCKIALPPGPFAANLRFTANCNTAGNDLPNGPYRHAERQVLAGEKGRLAMQNGIDANKTGPL